MKNDLLPLLILFILLLVNPSIVSAQSEHELSRLRISASGGLGYFFAEGDNEIEGLIDKSKIDKINKDLRWATHLNGDVHYLINNSYGIGAKYIFQKTSAEASETLIFSPDDMHVIVTDLWEKDYINYTGLSLGAFSELGYSSKFNLTSSISAGYAWIRSELSVLYQNMLITGGNVAMYADIGADYRFHPNLAIGLNLGTFYCIVDKVNISDGNNSVEQKLDKDSRYNASNIHLLIGLRYYLNR